MEQAMGVKNNYMSMYDDAPDEDLEDISEDIYAEEYGDKELSTMKREIEGINQRIKNKNS